MGMFARFGVALLHPTFRRAEFRYVPRPFLVRSLPSEVLVLARYRAQTEDELSLEPGDLVRQVRAGPARGWLRGELRGRLGLFPRRLVQVRPVWMRPRGSGSGPGPSLGPRPERRPV